VLGGAEAAITPAAALDQLAGDVDEVGMGPVESAGHHGSASPQVVLDLVSLPAIGLTDMPRFVHLFERPVKTVAEAIPLWRKHIPRSTSVGGT
jgi:hypothetical protein